MLAPGLDGGVEQLARNISPGSYFVCSVNRVGGEWGSSVGAKQKRGQTINYVQTQNFRSDCKIEIIVYATGRR